MGVFILAELIIWLACGINTSPHYVLIKVVIGIFALIAVLALSFTDRVIAKRNMNGKITYFERQNAEEGTPDLFTIAIIKLPCYGLIILFQVVFCIVT